MFPPLFPIYIEALVPLSRYSTLLWLSGVVCLWLTRYTHPLGRRWGVPYYAFSALVRPLGVVLIAVGWLAMYAPQNPYGLGHQLGWLSAGSLIDVVYWLAILLFFALGVWSVATLGLRRTFLFRHLDDALITRGPYALVRHPQSLSALGVTFFGIRLFDPYTLGSPIIDLSFYGSLEGNWVLFALSLWLLSILEDRELAAHFGAGYEEYAKRVPRLFPN